MQTTKPPMPMTPDLAAVMALATPLIHAFAMEISKLSVEEQQRRIAKVLAQCAMRKRSTSLPIIEMQLPPGVNALWRSNRGRVHRSSQYESWRTSAGWEIKLQKPGRFEGP